ncbi:MAG: hypothetical protein JOY78_03090 [Pseudonocardia sp.]|nr:hypothetical protein [Pseudonocardia sp.]
MTGHGKAYDPDEQESEIIELLADGLTYDSITRRMRITGDVMKKLMVKLYRRADVHSHGELIDWAWWHGHLGDRGELLEANEELRKRNEALDVDGDREELLARIEALTNQVDNLQIMYQTALNFQGWQP